MGLSDLRFASMKIFFVYFFIGMAMVVAQTTVLTLPVFQGLFYDLLIPMVAFVRLGLPAGKGVVLVLTVGFAMDLFSGGPFGLYLTAYFWIFLGVQGISNFFDVRGNLFRSLLVGFCVLAENMMFCIFGGLPGELFPAFSHHVGPVAWQIVFGAMTGPAIIKGLECLLRKIKAAERDTGSKGQELSIP